MRKREEWVVEFLFYTSCWEFLWSVFWRIVVVVVSRAVYVYFFVSKR